MDSLGDAQSFIYRMLESTGKLSCEAHEIAAGKAGCIRTKVGFLRPRLKPAMGSCQSKCAKLRGWQNTQDTGNETQGNISTS